MAASRFSVDEKPASMRGRSPPGLQSCRRSGSNQDSAVPSPSPHTPEPPAVWDSAAAPEAERLATDAVTPPRVRSAGFAPLSARGRPQRAFGAAEELEGPPGLGWNLVPLCSASEESPPVKVAFSSRVSLLEGPSSWRSADTAQVPPPPPPPPVPELPVTHLSLGSVGHPHSCASACRYVKRKGGCREGAKCPNCHLCFWRRDREQNSEREAPPSEPAQQMEALAAAAAVEAASAACEGVTTLISIGTHGHPNCCGPACRYVRRKSGCRDGAACRNCHACLWTREMQVGSVGQTPSTNLLRESTQTLEGLIRLFLNKQDSRAEVPEEEAGPRHLDAPLDPIVTESSSQHGGTITPPRSTTPALPEANPEADDDALEGPPGLVQEVAPKQDGPHGDLGDLPYSGGRAQMEEMCRLASAPVLCVGTEGTGLACATTCVR